MQDMAEKVPGLVDIALSKLVETLLNQALKLDDQLGYEFTPFDGKVFQLTLNDLKQTFFIIYQTDDTTDNQTRPGTFYVQKHLSGKPDCHIKTNSLDLIQRNGRFETNGDFALAHQFMTALQHLDIDWEEQLSKVTGDWVAFNVGQTVREGQKIGRDAKQKMGQTLQEYLQFEVELLPTATQVKQFSAEVQKLEPEVDALSSRIENLMNTLK